MFKKLMAGVITAVLSLGVVALVAGPASAHHNTIWPEVTCATDGTYKINWSVENSETNKTEVITVSNNTAIVPVGTSFAFHETKNFPQSVSTPQDITLSLTGFWDGDTTTKNDDVYNNTSFTLTADKFPSGCVKVTPEATPQPSVCTGPNKYSDPTYTLKSVPGVTYTVDNVVKAPGTYPATNGTTVHVVATVSDPKYQIVGTSTWDFAFAKPDKTCTVEVEPVTPTLTQQACNGDPGQHDLAQYTIPNTTGVIYSVKFGNTETIKAAGTYDLPDGVTKFQVIARADEAKFYTLKGGPAVVYDLEVIPAGTCLTDVKPKEPTVNDAVCTAPGVVTPTTYTLTYVAHVVYQVSVDGGATFNPVTITQDTTFNVAQGTVLWVKASVDDATKYQLKPADFLYKHTFPAPGDCKEIVKPVKPDPTHQYCDDSKDPRVVVDGTITINPADHVEYYLDGNLIAAGTYPIAPGDHEITVSFDTTKYTLDPNSHIFPYKFTINPGKCLPTHPLVTPASVSTQIGCFTAGSYTLSNNINDAKAVIWTVNGSQVAQGKYTVTGAGTVTITAAPNAPDYGFNPGVQTTWTVDFKKPAVCDTETLAMTGQSPTGLLIAADLLVVAGLAMFAMRAVRRGRLQS